MGGPGGHQDAVPAQRSQEDSKVEDYSVSNLYDAASLKETLDTLTMKAMRDAGLEVDCRIQDAKLALYFVCTIVGVFSHYHQYMGVPMPFPASKPMLAACVVVWVLCAGAAHALSHFAERDGTIR